MSHIGWKRRSSSLRTGRPSSQDPRHQDRNSRIPVPRSSSQPPGPGFEMPGLVRSRSNLDMLVSTPCHNNPPPNFTPLNNLLFTPLSGASSSQRPIKQKDQRNIQDKDFQREASALVLGYFQANCPSVLKGSDIRPMEIKMFIDMINHLFERLGHHSQESPVQFTRATYEKELPSWMKMLEYPGSITKGWLQTVNVPQYWPQVLSLLSWLVAIVHEMDVYDSERQLYADSNKIINVSYFFNCLNAHNAKTGDEPDPFGEHCRQQVRIEDEASGITEDEIVRLEAEMRQLSAQVNDPQWQLEIDALDELEQRLTIAQSLATKATDEVDKKNDAIEAIKAEAAKRERNIATLRSEAEQCRRECQGLKETIEKQAMSVDEFAELKKKCDYILKEIDYMEKEREDIEVMLGNYEQDLTAKRDKILQSASAFNRNVIQLEQQIPELTGLRARVNPESATVVEDVQRQVEALKELKNRLVADCQELENKRVELQNEREKLKIQEHEEAENEQKIQASLAAIKAEIDQLNKSKLEEEKTYKAKIDELERVTSEDQRKEKELETLNVKLSEVSARNDLAVRAKEAMDASIEELWKVTAGEMEIIYKEINAFKRDLSEHDEYVKKKMSELIAKHRPDLGK